MRPLKSTIRILAVWCFILISLSFAPNRDSWQQPQRIMDSIMVQPGMVIGEIGAGSGYFTFKLSGRVGPGGKIYANDIKADVLQEIEEKYQDLNNFNISTVLGKTNDPQFPDSSLDMCVMMIAFHDFSEPVAMLNNLKKALRPGAKLVIIERDPDKWPAGRGHFWPEDKIVRLLGEANYTIIRILRFLDRDTIFECIPEVRMNDTLTEFLLQGPAHVPLSEIFKHLDDGLRHKRMSAHTSTIWEEIEHMRLAQLDIYNYMIDPEWLSPNWPAGYWPALKNELTEDEWQTTVDSFETDLKKIAEFTNENSAKIMNPIPHASHHTYLREILLVIDHNAYHAGKIILIRKYFDNWPG